MNGNKSRVTTIAAGAVVATVGYWLMRAADAPHWACWMTALLVYLHTVISVRITGGKR